MERKFLIRKGTAIALGVAGFLLVYGTDEANELLATGLWRVLKFDFSEDEPVITLVRVK